MRIASGRKVVTADLVLEGYLRVPLDTFGKQNPLMKRLDIDLPATALVVGTKQDGAKVTQASSFEGRVLVVPLTGLVEGDVLTWVLKSV